MRLRTPSFVSSWGTKLIGEYWRVEFSRCVDNPFAIHEKWCKAGEFTATLDVLRTGSPADHPDYKRTLAVKCGPTRVAGAGAEPCPAIARRPVIKPNLECAWLASNC